MPVKRERLYSPEMSKTNRSLNMNLICRIVYGFLQNFPQLCAKLDFGLYFVTNGRCAKIGRFAKPGETPVQTGTKIVHMSVDRKLGNLIYCAEWNSYVCPRISGVQKDRSHIDFKR